MICTCLGIGDLGGVPWAEEPALVHREGLLASDLVVRTHQRLAERHRLPRSFKWFKSFGNAVFFEIARISRVTKLMPCADIAHPAIS